MITANYSDENSFICSYIGQSGILKYKTDLSFVLILMTRNLIHHFSTIKNQKKILGEFKFVGSKFY
jgi:hypothetical protein